MNWFTKSYVSSKTLENKKRIIDRSDDCCEHVAADPALLFAVHRENDSFGSESTCLCEACSGKVTEEEEAEEHVCADCGATFTLESGGVLWKWYDFYAAQGDEPRPICGACRTSERHLARVRKDRADYEEESGFSSDFD